MIVAQTSSDRTSSRLSEVLEFKCGPLQCPGNARCVVISKFGAAVVVRDEVKYLAVKGGAALDNNHVRVMVRAHCVTLYKPSEAV